MIHRGFRAISMPQIRVAFIPAAPGRATNHDQIKRLLFGWFFLPPTETDVVLVHLRLELSTTDDDANDVDDIQPGPCATGFPAPRVAHKVAPARHTAAPQASTASSPTHTHTPSAQLVHHAPHASNSTSSQQQNGGRQHYVPPPSPHPSSYRARSNSSASGDKNGGSSGEKAVGERRGECRGHRNHTECTRHNKGINNGTSPKRWTPAQLAAYLGGEVDAWVASFPFPSSRCPSLSVSVRPASRALLFVHTRDPTLPQASLSCVAVSFFLDVPRGVFIPLPPHSLSAMRRGARAFSIVHCVPLEFRAADTLVDVSINQQSTKTYTFRVRWPLICLNLFG
ncbi:hypothetical protein C8J57DRAFT_1576622 [Mycena rebaudengoi]|nr:hypothetical protein C8J57DRAFT_1576622 [Mycena rebaudengoi]